MKKDRTTQILSLLAEERRIEVTALAGILGVSQVTVRRDLDALENRGIIKREHGYAVLSGQDDIRSRLAYHYTEKRKIALRAAELVQNGSTIIIENGSCCTLLADALTESKRDLTLITNSAFLADYIRRKSNFQIILLGGFYQQEAQVMVGPLVSQCAENFWVDLMFIGVDGYSSQAGFTNKDQMRAQAVRDMARQAEQVIALTESEKFTKHGTVPLNLGDQLKIVITDSQISAETVADLTRRGIEIYTVE